MKNILVKIRRGSQGSSLWEEFAVRFATGMTVADLLREIQLRPVTREGVATTPVVWDECLQLSSCGTCTMLINGKALSACETFVDELNQPVILEPLSKFSLLRDLMVDRRPVQNTFETAKMRDGFFSYEEPLLRLDHPPASLTSLSLCTECQACVEACPQYRNDSKFVGPRILTKAFADPYIADEQELYLSSRGVLGCDNTQNCVRVCPEKIPLTDLIGLLKRKSIKVFLKSVLG